MVSGIPPSSRSNPTAAVCLTQPVPSRQQGEQYPKHIPGMTSIPRKIPLDWRLFSPADLVQVSEGRPEATNQFPPTVMLGSGSPTSSLPQPANQQSFFNLSSKS